MRRAAMLPILLLAGAGSAPRTPAAPPPTLAPDTEARWVPFTITSGGQMRFSMALDGREVAAILDTGVTYSALSRAYAARAARPVTAGGRAAAVAGNVDYDWAAIRSLAVGGLNRSGGRLSVIDLPPALGGDAVALVGRDLIGDYALEIDFAAGRFRLLPSGRLPFAGTTAPLALSSVNRTYVTRISIAGRPLAPIILDTGDGAALTLSAESWQAVGTPLPPATSTIGYGLAGPVELTMTVLPRISLGALTTGEVETRIEPPGGFARTIGVAGRIGTDLLSRYHLLLDPSAGRMVLAPTPGTRRRVLRSTSGLLFSVAPDRLNIVMVMRNGPAAAAGGWQAGDAICAIDGQPVTPAYPTQPIAGWSVATPGRVVALTLCGGERRKLALKRFY